MSGQISIKHDEVYSKTAALRSLLNETENRMDSEYKRILSRMDTQDGAAASGLAKTIEANKEKAVMAKTTLEKLLTCMDSVSKLLQTFDKEIEGIIATSGEVPGLTGGRG
jgi:hypothetical protein